MRDKFTEWLGITPARAGKTLVKDNNSIVVRITPARAGKTDGAETAIHAHQDHPRSCGKDT